MKTLKSKQDGFSAVEALLILIIVAVIGIIGWYVWRSRNTNKPTSASKSLTSSSTTNTATTNQYQGWKTYDWKAEGMTFKYPSNWVTNDPQLTADEAKNQPVITPTSPAIYLFDTKLTTINGFTGTSGLNDLSNYSGGFAIEAGKDSSDNIEGSSAASNTIPGFSNSPGNESITKIIPVSVPGYKDMSIVEESEYGYASQLAITDAKVSIGTTQSSKGGTYTSLSPDDSFQSKSTSGDRVSFTIGFWGEDKVNSPLNFAFISMKKDTFESQLDYQVAINILKSITYQNN